MEQLTTFQKCMIAARQASNSDKSATNTKLDKPTNPMYHDNKLGGNEPMDRPSLEVRFGALERRQFNLEIRVEDLAQEMTTGMKRLSDDLNAGSQQLTQYHMITEQQIDERFNRVDERLDKMDARFDKVETDISGMKGDIATLKEDMTGVKADVAILKEDMTGVKGDIAILKEDMTGVKGDIVDIKSTMEKSHQETVQVLIQILERLPSP